MKKAYQKPEIMFEDFSLSVNIAGDCEAFVNNASKGTCAIITSSGDPVFSGAITGCIFKPEDMGGEADMWDGFCYHIPIDDKSLFNS